MLLFWIENLVIGVYHALRLGLVSRSLGAFIVPFFVLHYGLFTLVHGVFVAALFVDDLSTVRVVLPAVGALLLSHGVSFVVNFLRGGEMARMRAATGIFRTRKVAPRHWVSETTPEEATTHPRGLAEWGDLMLAPYRRVIVMHLTLIFGAFLLMALGTPLPALALLVVLKTVLDVRAHVNERKRFEQLRAPPAAT